MRFMTSYFYHVRHFTPNMIPVSTARSDPKWFHDGRGNEYQFVDKNGVMNGLRAPVFAPGQQLEGMCGGHDGCNTDPDACPFLKGYAAQLATLDFEHIMGRFEALAAYVQDKTSFTDEPIIVLLVHEVTDNLCSERAAIQEWFRKHGVECDEFYYTPPIDKFDGEYSFLSNFYPSPFNFKNLTFPTVEHWFQALKTNDTKEFIEIAGAATPAAAKALGKKCHIRENWDDVKVDIMRKGLEQKFKDPELRIKLLATGDAKLTEGNYWHDNIWGQCYCDKCKGIAGQNTLGKLLMEIRDKI